MTEHPDIVSVERVIAAPPEQIFELIADPRRHRDIDGSGAVRDAKPNGGERLSLGAEFGMSMKLGIPYSMVSEVIEFEDGRRIAWQTRPPGPVLPLLFGGRVWRYELEPAGDGTLGRESWDISQEKVKAMVGAGVVRNKPRVAMEETLERIDALVTGPTPSRSRPSE